MILIIGAKGNMGRKYAAILKYLNIAYYGVDLNDPYPLNHVISHAIITTPTEAHYKTAVDLTHFYNCKILIEKPITDNLDDARTLSTHKNIYVVNNWAFAIDNEYLSPHKNEIYYNYYHTGPHGITLDCIQLSYLARTATIVTHSPVFEARINETRITLEDIQRSYIRMIKAFYINDKDRLWTSQDGYCQLKEVLK